MLAARDIDTQVDSFHGALCPTQGYAAAPLMDFCVCVSEIGGGGEGSPN